jgi:hypothetical protein
MRRQTSKGHNLLKLDGAVRLAVFDDARFGSVLHEIDFKANISIPRDIQSLSAEQRDPPDV